MSCSSCGGQGCNCCNPCCGDNACDPNNEPLASALNNFITAFYGTVTKSCVNDAVVWELPCDLDTGLPGFERRQGEGTACYLLRLFEYLNSIVAGGIAVQEEGTTVVSPTSIIDFVGANVTVTDGGGGKAIVTITVPPPSGCMEFYDKIAINGECYDTWQAAYDANVAAAVPTLMLVGQGTAFGDLNLTAAYNSNIVVMGVGRAVSNLGNITGNGNAVNIAAFNIQMGTVTSEGAAITLNGLNVVFGAISSANAAGAGGAISIGAAIETGSITSTGTTGGGAVTVATLASVGAINSSGVTLAGGAVVLGREVVGTSILATGLNGGSVTLGDECTVTTITSKPLTAPNSGGIITIADDCVTGNIDNSGTVAGTNGASITTGDRCEFGTINASGEAGGGSITLGVDCQSLDITTEGVTTGNGGAITIGRRGIIVGTINCNGASNGGALTIGFNAAVTAAATGNGVTGTSGPVDIQDGGRFSSLTFSAGGNAGNITIGKFCVVGAISSSSSGGGTVGNLTIGDGTTVGGTVVRNGTGTGLITLGNTVTITADITSNSQSGNSGGITIGRGCNLQGVNLFTNSGNGGAVVIGAATTCLDVRSHTGGGAGKTSGSITVGSGASTGFLRAQSPVAGANSGSVVLEPGASCTNIEVDSNSGTGGNVTLKNSNLVSGTITMGTSNTGTILSINSKITDQIDNVNGSSIFRDLVGSTPAGNRDFIANLTANGAQFTNCLIVPHGTGVSIQASVPRTVIAYQFLQKNAFPANVTLSEGSEITSPNLSVP